MQIQNQSLTGFVKEATELCKFSISLCQVLFRTLYNCLNAVFVFHSFR